jgi:hypothetical protein
LRADNPIERERKSNTRHNAAVSILLAGFFVFVFSHLILIVVVAGLIAYRVSTDEVHRILWIAALLAWLVGGAVLVVAISQIYAAAATAPILVVTVAWILAVAVRKTRAWARAATAVALVVWTLFSLVGVGTLELVVAAGGLQWPATTGLP